MTGFPQEIADLDMKMLEQKYLPNVQTEPDHFHNHNKCLSTSPHCPSTGPSETLFP